MFFPLFLLVPVHAEVARLFRRLGLLRFGLVHEQVLEVLDLSFKFFDLCSLFLDSCGLPLKLCSLFVKLQIALAELFFEFGNCHAKRYAIPESRNRSILKSLSRRDQEQGD